MIATDELRTVVVSSFQASQSSVESHRALTINLEAAHKDALRNQQGNEFQQQFVRCLDRIIPTTRKDQCANRVMEFVADYIRLVCPEDAEEDDENFETFVEFVESIIERYIPGFDSRLSQVRFRCISLVGTLVPLAPLNEELLAVLEKKAIERLRDSDSRVRVQAVILVSRFDLSKTTASALACAMQYDPSAEVRLVATFNIAHGSKALTELACERVRDSAAQIRRGTYSKVLPTIDFRTLSIKARENIVRSGINDRDFSVKQAAAALVARKWVSMSDNNIELVLQRLDVIGHTEIADLVLSTFFEMRRDVLEQLEFGEEFWNELWIEDTVLLRGFQEFCLKEKLGEFMYDRMPDLATLALEIEKFWMKYIDPKTYENASSEDEAEDLRECLPFMVEQLLKIASRYDLEDEASRQKITAVIGDIVMAETAPSNETIEQIVAIQRRLNASDTALVSWAFETLEAMSSSTQASDETLITNLLRSLSLFNAVLSRVSSHDVAAYLPTLYTSFIMPALQSPAAEIRQPALRCLGLACLLDKPFAVEHVAQFAEIISQNGETLLRPRLGNEEETDIEQEMVLSIGAMTDMLLVHVEANLPSKAVANMWVSLLRSTRPCIRGSAAISLAKLVLSGSLEDTSSVLTRLILFHFETTNETGTEDNADDLTQQQLTLFWRAYCLFEEGKDAVASIFTTVLSQFIQFRSTNRNAITIGALINQILELTQHDAHQKRDSTPTEHEPSEEDPTTWHHAHAQISYDLLKLIFTTEDVPTCRSMASSLTKVDLFLAPLPALEQILALVDSQGDLNEIKVAGVRNPLLLFRESVSKLIETRKAAIAKLGIPSQSETHVEAHTEANRGPSSETDTGLHTETPSETNTAHTDAHMDAHTEPHTDSHTWTHSGTPLETSDTLTEPFTDRAASEMEVEP